MGRIKSVCIAGARYCENGLMERAVLGRLLALSFGTLAPGLVDHIIRFWPELAEEHDLRVSWKLNCWEARRCTTLIRGKGGGAMLCPALTATALCGIHGGMNGGRACWTVRGTFCAGQTQGTMDEKRPACGDCSFFRSVAAEEGPWFLGSEAIVRIARRRGGAFEG